MILAAELLRLEGDAPRALELAAFARAYPELDAENVEAVEALWGKLQENLSAKMMEEAAKVGAQKAQDADSLHDAVAGALQTM